jgi:beta-glucanase (GH16 family)
MTQVLAVAALLLIAACGSSQSSVADATTDGDAAGADAPATSDELPASFSRDGTTYALSWVENFDDGLGRATVGDWTFDTNAAWFYPTNTSVADGRLDLRLTARGSETIDTDRVYLGGEYDRTGSQLFGRFLTRMKPSAPPGVIASFFTAMYEFDPDFRLLETAELDIEFVGTTREVQLTVHWVDAGGVKRETAETVALDFDAGADVRTWEIEWLADRIVWYVDGVELHRFTDAAVLAELALPQEVKANLWISTSVPWAGAFAPSSLPVASQYDWIAAYTVAP